MYASLLNLNDVCRAQNVHHSGSYVAYGGGRSLALGQRVGLDQGRQKGDKDLALTSLGNVLQAGRGFCLPVV